MPRIFGNRFGNVSRADGYLDDKKSVYNRFDQYFSLRRFGWFSKVVASGGTEITTDTHKYHVFLSPGTLTVTTGGRVDYLVVGRGGDGGSIGNRSNGSGGGGGGVNVGSNYIINSPQSIVVASSPGQSSFGSISAGRGSNALVLPFSGQGGPSGSPNPYEGGTTSPSTNYRGGGGGGSGGSGGNATPTSGGTGGNGIAVPWASAPIISPAIPAPIQPSWIPAVGYLGYYGGGGGGSTLTPSPTGSSIPGGLGGGGSGAVYLSPPLSPITQSINGIEYTGGGAGGGGSPTKIGGSGIVIIRYAI